MRFLYPMCPVNVTRLPPTPVDYYIQPKFNGWHVVLTEDGIYTKHGNSITHWNIFETLKKKLKYIRVNLVGELINLDDMTPYGASRLRTSGTPKIIIHDCMKKESLSKRLRTCDKIVRAVDSRLIRLSTSFDGRSWEEVNEFIINFQKMGHEGVVLKKETTPYLGSLYSVMYCPDWIKLKEPVEFE